MLVAVRDGPRTFAQQQAQRILLLLDLLFELRNLRGGGVLQLLGLAQIGERRRSGVGQPAGEIDGLLTSLQRLLRDLQLAIQSAQLDIRRRDLLHQRHADSTLRPNLSQQLRSRSLRLPAVESPEVGRPRGRKIEAAGVRVCCRPGSC